MADNGSGVEMRRIGSGEVAVRTVMARGVQIRFAVSNPRLGVWAEQFERIEPELLDAIDALPEGTVFYDLGASIGLFSLYAALKRRCPVVAFEPDAQNYATLELNHLLNRDRLAAPYLSFAVAVSDQTGLGHMHARLYGAGEHTKVLDRARMQDTKEDFTPTHVQSVLTFPLDRLLAEFALPRPQFLKIDVDGAETQVLRGAAATLDDPDLRTVFIELSEHDGPPAEAAMLEAHGFRVAAKVPVVRLSGGFYSDLYNWIFRR